MALAGLDPRPSCPSSRRAYKRLHRRPRELREERRRINRVGGLGCEMRLETTDSAFVYTRVP